MTQNERLNNDSGDDDHGERNVAMPADVSVAHIVPGPDEHPLEHKYTFWFKKQTWKKMSQNYDQNLERVLTVSSVEQFWRLYSHLIRPMELQPQCILQCFRSGISPMWEDEANRNGGRWMIHLKKHNSSLYWERLLLAMLGEQFMIQDEICGVVVSVKFKGDVLSLWNRSGHDVAVRNRIRDTLRRILSIPSATHMEYKVHTEHTPSNSKEPPRYTPAMAT